MFGKRSSITGVTVFVLTLFNGGDALTQELSPLLSPALPPVQTLSISIAVDAIQSPMSPDAETLAAVEDKETEINQAAANLLDYSCNDRRLTECCRIDVDPFNEKLPRTLMCVIPQIGISIALSQSPSAIEMNLRGPFPNANAAQDECAAYCAAYLPNCNVASTPEELKGLVGEESVQQKTYAALVQKYKALICTDTGDSIWRAIGDALNCYRMSAGAELRAHLYILGDKLLAIYKNKAKYC